MAPTKKTRSSSKENPQPSRSRAKAANKSSKTQAPLQDHNQASSSTASRDGAPAESPQDETARIHELEALLRDAHEQLQAAHARQHGASDAEPGPTTHRKEGSNEPIPAPSRVSEVTMEAIRAHLGYDKRKWSALWSCVRDSLRAARLNWDLPWKSQSTTKLGYAYNAVEDDFRELRRFVGQWAVHRIAKDVWDNHKTYLNCVDKPSTYIGRRAAERHGAGGSSRHTTSPPRVPSPRHSSPRTSPSPGPSHPPARPLRRRIDSSSSSGNSGDDLLHFSDGEPPNDLEEEDDDPSGRGKKRARSSGGSSPKRRRL
ncbi:hypothetical protein B0H14DRAFT_2953226 [Mycena olivaceomarginata]|nr:hypothetical protein B0H14DRAFT_2953226 [Mycena olivaceomarginata]